MPVTDLVNEAEAAPGRGPSTVYGDFRQPGMIRGQSGVRRDKRSDGCWSRVSGGRSCFSGDFATVGCVGCRLAREADTSNGEVLPIGGALREGGLPMRR
jgi:hypothetical protein